MVYSGNRLHNTKISQQNTVTPTVMTTRHLEQAMNRIIFPDSVERLVTRLEAGNINNDPDIENVIGMLKEKVEKARSGRKNYVTLKMARIPELPDVNRGGWCDYDNPLTGKPETVQATLYKKPVSLDIDSRLYGTQFNSASKTGMNFSAEMVKDLSRLFGGKTRDVSLTEDWAEIRQDNRLSDFNAQKNLVNEMKSRKASRIPEPF